MPTIAYIRVNRQNAMRLTTLNGPDIPDTQLITLTAAVVDEIGVGQPGVRVYWGFSGVNAYTLSFYDMNKSPFTISGGYTTTGTDGTTSLFVGSDKNCIANVTAGLSAEAAKAGQVSQTIGICTFDVDGDLPTPTVPVDQEGKVAIPPYSGPSLPAPALYDQVLVGNRVASGSPYMFWMCHGNDTELDPGKELGELIGPISNYAPQNISYTIPFAKMASGTNGTNFLAYMVFNGRNPRLSGRLKFSASGQALKRPDDENNPPDSSLGPPFFVSPDITPPAINKQPPDLLTFDDFDLKGKLNFVIPDYDGRLATDTIVVKAYLNAWLEGSPTAHTDDPTVSTLSGSKFNNGFLPFFILQSTCENYCPYPGSNRYGYIWILYIVNGMHYSQSFFTNINFCEE